MRFINSIFQKYFDIYCNVTIWSYTWTVEKPQHHIEFKALKTQFHTPLFMLESPAKLIDIPSKKLWNHNSDSVMQQRDRLNATKITAPIKCDFNIPCYNQMPQNNEEIFLTVNSVNGGGIIQLFIIILLILEFIRFRFQNIFFSCIPMKN